MQLLIDSVRYQVEKGFKNPRIVLRKIKDEGEALQEAAEQIRCLIAECIERNLPIDDALAALHVATLKGNRPNKDDYKNIIEKSRNEPAAKIKQAGSKNIMNLLRKIELESKK